MRPFARLFALIMCLFALPAVAAAAPTQTVDAAVRATPPLTTDKENLWLLDLSDGGRVTIWLRPDVAPKMVERIKTLTRQGFYNGLLFHRVIDGFMAQGGDPKGDGTGGSTLPNVPAEFNYLPHVRGAVSAARADDENSANSQFFIVFQPRLSLDKKYTIFGRVIDGMQYVDAIERGEPPADPTRVIRAYIAADNPPAYTPMAAPAPVTLGAPVTLPGSGSGSARAAGKAVPKKAPANTVPKASVPKAAAPKAAASAQ
jgi:peptidylprolyl isomerase